MRHGGALRLSSPLYPAPWLPGEPFQAVCRRTLAALPWARPSLHEPPNHDCICGVHAVRRPELALPYLGPAVRVQASFVHRVIGTVALWGRAVEGPGGWRAAHAYPAQIFVPIPSRGGLLRRSRGPALDELISDLADYGVPVARGIEALEDGWAPGSREGFERRPAAVGAVLRAR